MERQKSDNTHVVAKKEVDEDKDQIGHKTMTQLQLIRAQSMGNKALGDHKFVSGMDSAEGGKRFPNENISSDSFNVRYMQENRTVPNAGEVSMFDRDAKNG